MARVLTGERLEKELASAIWQRILYPADCSNASAVRSDALAVRSDASPSCFCSAMEIP